MKHLPSLPLLRSFEAAAKHQSFTLAAEELHVTQSAISRMVRELEGQLGFSLFRPAGRGVTLTEAERNLADKLHGDLERLRQTLMHAGAAGDLERTLTIGVLPTFGSRWMAPRLLGFRNENPNVQLAILSRAEPFDLVKEGIDLAVHFGRKEWINGELTELCPEDLVAVAAPSMVADHADMGPEAISSLPLLHLRTRADLWRSYFEDLGLDTTPARRGAIFDQFSTMIPATRHGLGAAIVPTYLIEEELADKSLAVLGRVAPPDGMYYVVTPKGVQDPVAQAFKTWIVREVRRSRQERINL